MRAAILAVFAICFGLAGQARAGDISPQANQEYLVANAKKPGVVVLPSGLQYRVIKSGDGATPAPSDMVTVIYKGELIDGLVFDDSKGEARHLPADKVIQGWQEALSLMKVGDVWELVIPSTLGYGEARTARIPSNQTLLFRMELVATGKPEQ